MKDKKYILDGINRLLEKQVETLKGKVTSDQAIAYARRRTRIRELVFTVHAAVATEQ